MSKETLYIIRVVKGSSVQNYRFIGTRLQFFDERAKGRMKGYYLTLLVSDNETQEKDLYGFGKKSYYVFRGEGNILHYTPQELEYLKPYIDF